ncbi:MAG: DUF4258 domain-containing protein [Alphaproteobacteria bacterium]
MVEAIRNYRITPHAEQEMARRGIDLATVQIVLSAPGQRETVRPGRDVLQARVAFGEREYLVRVFVDVDRMPAEVVTVYCMSNVAKYWRPHR